MAGKIRLEWLAKNGLVLAAEELVTGAAAVRSAASPANTTHLRMVGVDGAGLVTWRDDAALTVTTSTGRRFEFDEEMIVGAGPGYYVSALETPTGETGGGLVPVRSTSAASSQINLKTGPGNLYSLTVSNTQSPGGWICIMDTASVIPAGAAAPAQFFHIPANATVTFDAAPGGVPSRYVNGIRAVFSTTGPFDITPTGGCAFSGLVQ